MQPKTFQEQFFESVKSEEFAKLELERYEDEEGICVYSSMMEVDEEDIPYLAQFFFYEEDELADVVIAKPIKDVDSLETYRLMNEFNADNRFVRMVTQEGMLCVRGNVWKEEGVEALWDIFFLCVRVAGGYFSEFESDVDME
ncbi:MAG: hypothetical protein E7277_05940 [Lachnospiraceae bacterium]|nr:hypothetical protein [Lachnospiraceae bacterium]